jgi:hypothetical protein
MQKMKKTLTTILFTLTTGVAFGHGEIELGPNKGRIIEFSSDESLHAALASRASSSTTCSARVHAP